MRDANFFVDAADLIFVALSGAAIGTRPILPPAVALLVAGRWAWLATEHRLRVTGTLGQH